MKSLLSSDRLVRLLEVSPAGPAADQPSRAHCGDGRLFLISWSLACDSPSHESPRSARPGHPVRGTQLDAARPLLPL